MTKLDVKMTVHVEVDGEPNYQSKDFLQSLSKLIEEAVINNDVTVHNISNTDDPCKCKRK